MSIIEYALNAFPRHGERRSVMSQLQTWPGPVAISTGFSRGVRDPRPVGTRRRALWSSISAAIRHHDLRAASITPRSQVAASVCLAECAYAEPAEIFVVIVVRTAVAIRDR